MPKRRTLIIGDVHGCYLELKALLQKLGYHRDADRLIFVGDLINRGPDSLKVLHLAQTLNAEVVMGNHEVRFLNYLNSRFGDTHFENLITALGDRLQFWTKWITQLPYYIEDKNFLVVHGGRVPGQHPRRSDPQLLINIRTWDGKGKDLKNPLNPAWFTFYEDPKLTVYGHWASMGLVVRKNVIGLDSGCVYGNKLSAVELPGRRIYQVNARKIYFFPKGVRS